ncbi:MAG: SPOR domain-containing protein [Acidobacteriota bacterium]
MTRIFQVEQAVPGGEPQYAKEFEIVMGRGQMASVSFLVLVALACGAGGAYWVGRASGRVVEVAAPAATAARAAAPVTLPVSSPVTAPEIVKAETVSAPLFAQPLKGPFYIQLGSVEKGYAALMAQGARKVGYPAIVAAGANQNVYRVLVGPFQTAEDYRKAKAEFDGMGLDTFSRKYQE